MRVSFLLPLLFAIPCSAQQSIAKRELPSSEAQKSALAVVAGVYKPDYEKAKTPVQKIALARKLLDDGVATNDDPHSRFVLFRVARDIASQQGDLVTAFAAVDRICSEYDADALQMKVDAATVALESSKTQKELNAALLEPLIVEAIDGDRYNLAKTLVTMTLSIARENRNGEHVKQATSRLKEIEELSVEFEKARVAKATLDANPTDANANFALGRFLCLFKGDWERGITMLALSDKEEFKSAASLELATPPEAVKVGDAWWKIAESLDGKAKGQAERRASEWYRRALPGLSGLSKARAEKRIAAFDGPKKRDIKSTDPVSATTRLDRSEPSPWTQLDLREEALAETFAFTGDWRAMKNGGIEFVGGSLAKALSREKYTTPIAVKFKVLCRSDAPYDIWPGVCGVRLMWGVDFNRSTTLVVGKRETKLEHVPIVPDRLYEVQITIDEARKLTITIGTSVVFQATIDRSIELSGPIVLGGGIGHVIYSDVSINTGEVHR